MRIRTWTATVALAALLAACGSQGADEGGDEAAAGGDGGCTEVSQGITDDGIKLGTTLPLSGGAAVAGAGFQDGINAAVEEANADGGVNDRTVEMIILDDGFEAARSVGNVRRLGDEEQVFAVVSPAGTANLPGSYQYLEGKGLIMFAPVLPPDPDIEPVYLLGTGHTDQVRVIVDWLAEQGVETVGLISQDNDLGAAFEAGLDEQTPKHDIEVVANVKVEPNSTDINSAVLELIGADPDAVISGADNTQTTLLLRQAYDQGWDPIIIGNSSSGGPGSPNTVEPAGPGGEGFYASAILEFPTSDSDAVQEYRDAMEAIGSDQTNNSFALQGYANTKVFLHILSEMGDDLCWENFQAMAEGLSNYETGLIAPVTFGELPDGHTGTTGARIAEYTGGEWTFVTEFLEPQD